MCWPHVLRFSNLAFVFTISGIGLMCGIYRRRTITDCILILVVLLPGSPGDAAEPLPQANVFEIIVIALITASISFPVKVLFSKLFYQVGFNLLAYVIY